MTSIPSFRARRPLLAGLACLALAPPAHADRASLAIEQSVTGQTNPFRAPDGEDADPDGSYEIRPRLRLVRGADEFGYRIDYAPSYDVYFDTGGIDGFDQFGRAELYYAPTRVGTATLRTEIAYYRSIRSDTFEDAAGVPEVVADVSGRVFRALGEVGYEHAFTRTTTGSARLGLQSYEYSTVNNADSLGLRGELDLVHELRSAFAVGALAGASHRRFDDLTPEPASHNVVVHAGPILRAEPSEGIFFEAAAGPAWVRTDRDRSEALRVPRFRTLTGTTVRSAVFDGCGTSGGRPLLSLCPLAEAGGAAPQLTGGERVPADYPGGGRPDAGATDHFTAFARATLETAQPWGGMGVDYERNEAASSGNGATTLRDAVTARIEIGTRESRWSLRLRGNWNRRETFDRVEQLGVVAGPSPVPAGGGLFFAEARGLQIVDRERIIVVQYWADVTVGRRLTDSLSLELSGRYLEQERHGTAGSDDTFDNWRGIVMLHYAPSWLEIDYSW